MLILLYMVNNISLQDLMQNTRARVYLLWAVLTGIGFVATHYYQNKNINGIWIIISIIGLGYMYKVMPMRDVQMKKIFASWLVPITVGIIVSVLAVRTSLLPELVPYLGAYWLVVMAVGYLWNGLVDKPALWYFVAVGLNLLAAILIYAFDSFQEFQYLIAAIISVWSMLNLWIFRSEYY